MKTRANRASWGFFGWSGRSPGGIELNNGIYHAGGNGALTGGAGYGTLTADAEKVRLTGRAGIDILSGDTGADTVVL